VILSGLVLDPAGHPVGGAQVVITSLDVSVPYNARVQTGADGKWVVNNLPAGTTVRITAAGPGWVSPRHVFKGPDSCSDNSPMPALVLRGEATAALVKAFRPVALRGMTA
jgi:hypothetical protein